MLIGGGYVRDLFISNSMNLIRKNKPNYTKEKLEELEYGLTGLYILISKSIIIFSIAYLLGILKELIIFTLIYNLVRLPSFGIHASKSWVCLVVSTSLFIGLTYICTILNVNIVLKFILGLIGIIYMSKYSPADTEKRPIVNSKRRKVYKIISTIMATILVIVSVFVDNNFISNCCLFGLILQCAMISPITYKLSNQQYDNYKSYQFD